MKSIKKKLLESGADESDRSGSGARYSEMENTNTSGTAEHASSKWVTFCYNLNENIDTVRIQMLFFTQAI